MSLYADYIAERLGHSIIENEDGFATYHFPSEGICYLENIYVRPESRRKNIATTFAKMIEDIAKQKRCHTLLGSVCTDARGATESLKGLLSFGFKLDRVSDFNLIFFKKEI